MDALKLEDSMQSSSTLIAAGSHTLQIFGTLDVLQQAEAEAREAELVSERVRALRDLSGRLADFALGRHPATTI